MLVKAGFSLMLYAQVEQHELNDAKYIKHDIRSYIVYEVRQQDSRWLKPPARSLLFYKNYPTPRHEACLGDFCLSNVCLTVSVQVSTSKFLGSSVF